MGRQQSPLDYDQRHALAGHLDRAGMAHLMRSEASANAGPGGGAPELCTCPARRPRASARAFVDDAEQRTDRQRDSRDEPRLELLPAPVIHPDLATSPALGATDEQRAATAIEVRLTQRERFVDAKAGAPQHHNQSAKPPTVHTGAGDPHDRDDLLDGGRVGRIPQALVARRMTGVKAGHRRRRAAPAGGIKNGRSGHELQPRIRQEARTESAVHRGCARVAPSRTPVRAAERRRRAPPLDAGAALNRVDRGGSGRDEHECSCRRKRELAIGSPRGCLVPDKAAGLLRPVTYS